MGWRARKVDFTRQAAQNSLTSVSGPMTRINRLVVFVTGLHVLAHSVFGCCPHAFATVEPSTIQRTCSHSVDGFPKQRAHQHGDKDAARPCSEQGDESTTVVADGRPKSDHQCSCRHADCHWKAGEGTSALELRDLIGSAPVAWVTSAINESGQSFGFTFESAIECHRALPLRLHLMMGVLQV
jgi:hypothetical protein